MNKKSLSHVRHIIVVLSLLLIFPAECKSYEMGNIIGMKNSLYEGEISNVYRPFHPSFSRDYSETDPVILSVYRDCAEAAKKVKAYTKKGYALTKAPEGIVHYLQNLCRTAPRVQEFPPPHDPFFAGPPPYIIEIPEERKQWISAKLQPLMEKWAGTKLQPTCVFGAREYRKGFYMREHVDRETHIISVIIHINRDRGDGNNWGLTVREEGSNQTDVIYMNPGEMVLYESRRVHHGRPAFLPDGSDNRCPFDEFINLFVHYRPAVDGS